MSEYKGMLDEKVAWIHEKVRENAMRCLRVTAEAEMNQTDVSYCADAVRANPPPPTMSRTPAIAPTQAANLWNTTMDFVLKRSTAEEIPIESDDCGFGTIGLASTAMIVLKPGASLVERGAIAMAGAWGAFHHSRFWAATCGLVSSLIAHETE